MRAFLHILESLTIPSFVERVTDDLLDEMIATGKWVSHGGDLKNAWDNGIFDYAIGMEHPELEGRPYEEVINTKEFRDTLRRVVMTSAETQYEILMKGSPYDKIGPLTPDSFIYRGISGDLAPDRAGIFWSQSKFQSVGRFIGRGRDDERGTLLVAKVKDVTINWEQTIRSRLDLENGHEEMEIQLEPGSPVKAMAYRVMFDRARRPILTQIGPVTRLA